MTSEKRIVANRRNARRSTGPRTGRGKAITKMNALKHGLLSSQVLLSEEKARDLQELGQRLRGELRPLGELEHLLVDRIVAAVWRLRRALRVETAVMEQNSLEARLNDYSHRTRLPAELDRLSMRAMVVDDDAEKILRYESVIERQIYKALAELERLQTGRTNLPFSPGAVIDAEPVERKALPGPVEQGAGASEVASFGQMAAQSVTMPDPSGPGPEMPQEAL